jgi:hypothetical protein
MSFTHDLDNEYGARIMGDGGEDVTKGALFVTTGGVMPAAQFGRTAAGLTSVAPVRVLGTSLASGAVLGFAGGMISVTSILGFAATGAAIAFDYVLPIEVGGVIRGIPLTSLVSLVGAATF